MYGLRVWVFFIFCKVLRILGYYLTVDKGQKKETLPMSLKKKKKKEGWKREREKEVQQAVSRGK